MLLAGARCNVHQSWRCRLLRCQRSARTCSLPTQTIPGREYLGYFDLMPGLPARAGSEQLVRRCPIPNHFCIDFCCRGIVVMSELCVSMIGSILPQCLIFDVAARRMAYFLFSPMLATPVAPLPHFLRSLCWAPLVQWFFCSSLSLPLSFFVAHT